MPFAGFFAAPLLGAETRDCIRKRASFSAAIKVPNIFDKMRLIYSPNKRAPYLCCDAGYLAEVGAHLREIREVWWCHSRIRRTTVTAVTLTCGFLISDMEAAVCAGRVS